MSTESIRPGNTRSSGESVTSILDRDTRSVPDHLRATHDADFGSDDLPTNRYWSREFHELEAEHMWTRVWQFAAREEEIPEVGDYVVYEICHHSFIVMRTAPDTIRAYYNACLHRGRILKSEDGNCAQIKCPFHGFTWGLDGALKDVPCRWDFPQIEDEKFSLPEARVACWAGFVFLNMDDDAIPLEEYLAPIPAEFANWRLDQRYKAVHVGKVVAMNWKVGIEAFVEAYHSIATHPQILPYTGDSNTQYDVYSTHVNRMITPFGVPSPHLEGETSPNKTLEAMMGTDQMKVPDGLTAREFIAETMRGAIGGPAGWDLSGVSDSEMLDALQYHVFPNFVPWGGYLQNLVYRFRPWNDDPQRALMEVMMLAPVPASGPRPEPAKLHMLGEDEAWTEATELGPLAPIFQQDQHNMPEVQRGLRAAKKRGVTLGKYQEVRIRHLHRTLDRYLSESGPIR